MKILVFEGPDGCGKSTQLSLTAEYLRSKGLIVMKTKQPGFTRTGEAIRSITKNWDYAEELNASSLAERFLFNADHALFVDNVIKPSLGKNIDVMLMDRHNFVSDIAYGHFGSGVLLDLLWNTHRLVDPEQASCPDAIFVFLVSPEISKDRLKMRGEAIDRIEGKNDEFRQNVALGYKAIAVDPALLDDGDWPLDPKDVALFDGSESISALSLLLQFECDRIFDL